MYGEDTGRGRAVKEFYELMEKQDFIHTTKQDKSMKVGVWSTELLTFHLDGIKYVLKKEIRKKTTDQYRQGVRYQCGVVGESKYDMFEPAMKFDTILATVEKTKQFLNQ